MGPQILNSNRSHFEHNPHCLSSRRALHSLLPRCCFPPGSAFQAQAVARAPTLHPTRTSSHSDPAPPPLRRRPHSAALLSFPEAEGSSYPGTRGPVGLGAPDSASFDQGSFQVLAVRFPEPRSPALCVAIAPRQREERREARGVSRKQSPYRNTNLVSLVPERSLCGSRGFSRFPLLRSWFLRRDLSWRGFFFNPSHFPVSKNYCQLSISSISEVHNFPAL